MLNVLLWLVGIGFGLLFLSAFWFVFSVISSAVTVWSDSDVSNSRR